MAYDWPGNVRELENIIERSMILSPGQHPDTGRTPAHPPGTAESAPPATSPGRGLGPDRWRTLDEVERAHIIAVCERCGWRINGKGNAAERLGINPNTLRSRMQKLGIVRPSGVPQGEGARQSPPSVT